MLFNSLEFIFLFLPLAVLVYFILNKIGPSVPPKLWLTAASLLFYAWASILYLPLITGSILANYSLGRVLADIARPKRKTILTLGIIANVALLAYFKYANFFIANTNALLATDIKPLALALPVAISFFTFQQIAYLVDTYRGQAGEKALLDYAMWVVFFPQLLSGPIVRFRETMPQFQDGPKKPDYENISRGLYLFFIGLFKKAIIADTLAIWANHGFAAPNSLTLVEAWTTSLAYTMQLYFDFSGYTDMAIGIALMLNIKLPLNFTSPYRSLSIQEFWRRWHITLSRFLRDYIYIPLGGNRRGDIRLYCNLVITFLIGGLWHGAGWTFVFWGFLHGMGLVVNRLWRKTGLALNRTLAWFLTFNFVNIAWVFFRARSFSDALSVLAGMAGLNGLVPAGFISSWAGASGRWLAEAGKFVPSDLPAAITILLLCMALVLLTPNSIELKDRFKPGLVTAVFTIVLALLAITSLTGVSQFLYFNF